MYELNIMTKETFELIMRVFSLLVKTIWNKTYHNRLIKFGELED